MDEFEIIRRYFEPKEKSASVIVGVGDDGAILRPDPGHDIVTVTDTLVQGVHFPGTLCAQDIAYRAVAVNVSDIAAMGGRPRWMTLALTLVDNDSQWLEDFSRGIAFAADVFSIDLVGGDTTRGEQTVVSVQVIGDVLPGAGMTRSGAKPGDRICVSGTLGDAAAGLSVMRSGVELDEHREKLVSRFTRPDARIRFGKAIAQHASAAIDVSDGLYADLEKLLDASGVSGSIELNDVPLSLSLISVLGRDKATQFALSGGDDYELCFTCTEKEFVELAERDGVPVTRIGRIDKGRGLTCTLNGDHYDYHDKGYRHFE